MRIHSFEAFSTHDGPGIRLIIFLQGCNSKCVYCHNPDTWPEGGGREVEDSFILEKVKRSRPYFGRKGGVTFSGGEPLLQAEALAGLITKIRAMGVHTAVETNASIFTREVKRVLDLTDLLLLDLKHPDPKMRRNITGLSFNPLLLADYREEQNQPFWLRYVLAPGMTDGREWLDETGKIFSGYAMLERTEILPYHKSALEKYSDMGISEKACDVPIPDRKQISKSREILSRRLRNVVVR